MILPIIEYVPERIEPLIRRYKISKHDLYISIAGVYLGLVGTVPAELDDAQLTENAARIVFRDRNAQSAKFLTAYLNSECFRPQLAQAKGVGAGVPKLALERIARFWIPLPSPAEQTSVALAIERVDEQRLAELKFRSKLMVLKSGLMQDLLTGRVRVKIEEGAAR